MVLSELHPSKEALEGAIACAEGTRETFEQLDKLLGRIFKMALSVSASQNRRGQGATREHIATKYVTEE